MRIAVTIIAICLLMICAPVIIHGILILIGLVAVLVLMGFGSFLWGAFFVGLVLFIIGGTVRAWRHRYD